MGLKQYDPWEDSDCIEAFIEKNEEDFDLFIANKGVDPRFVKRSNYHLSYCEENVSEFTDFAYEFHQDDIAAQEEFKNDLREDR